MCGENSKCNACQSKPKKRSRKYLTQPIMPITQMGGDHQNSLGPPESLASFITACDQLLAWFAISMYQNVLPESQWGFTKSIRLSTPRIGVWIRNNDAIVSFRGTLISSKTDLLDDLKILQGSDSCDLSLSNQAVPILQDLSENGAQQIMLSGHSLGGKAALCLGSHPLVTRVVALNAGAPITNPDGSGPGPSKATHYHIVGDLISTHLLPSAANTIRIKVSEPNIHINWMSPWYHSTDRFFKNVYEFSNAQQEQDSLEYFFFNKAAAGLLLASTITSVVTLPFYESIKKLVCTTPIPGSKSNCSSFKDTVESIASAIAGATIGFGAGGPVGAIAGFQLASGISKGDIRGFLNSQVPGYEDISKGLRALLEATIDNALDEREDPAKAIQKLL